jgi:hypothetical protein
VKNLSLCGVPPHNPASPVRAYKKALPKKNYTFGRMKRRDKEIISSIL